MALESDVQSNAEVEPDRVYDYLVNHGPVLRPDSHDVTTVDLKARQSISDKSAEYLGNNLYNRQSGVTVSGRTLLRMRDGDFTDRQVLRESKRLLREQLRQVLDGKTLQSRRLAHGVNERLFRKRQA